MSVSSPRRDLSLKALEIFQICARSGSLQATATETGLAVSTISHHLRGLETHLGVALFDHNRRPMVLTPKGHVFLRNIDAALQAIRKAKAEAAAGTLSDASYLRIGAIEDLDSDIIPDLALHLRGLMPQCDFLYHTASSHDLIAQLHNRQLDLGITAHPIERLRDLRDRPLCRDPFVVVMPRDVEVPVAEVVAGQSDLPFLRFSSDLIIARQIEAQMRRLGVAIPERFASSNTQTLMAMVAAGAGWTLTTPLMFSRARRFQHQLGLHPFPGKDFARSLTLVATPDCAQSVFALVEQHLRQVLQRDVITPILARAPWLTSRFTLRD